MTEPELAPGDSGDDVLQVQAMLRALGFDSAAPDGHFSEATADAVRSFQQARGLPPTGIADVATRQALQEAAGSVPPAGPVTEEQQWHWDGEQWQPGGGPAVPRDRAVQHLSHDGQWLWDGSAWQQVQT